MPVKEPLIPFSEYDLNTVVADLDDIRKYNPQRFEAEQLTAIVYINHDLRLIVGYKDTSEDDFWVRGHMPGMPIMPGVLMCEAAAQLASYYAVKYDLLGAEMVGFGGLEDVRFRELVRPGDRLVLHCKELRVRRGAVIQCAFQGWVEEKLVFDGQLKGIPLSADILRSENDG